MTAADSPLPVRSAPAAPPRAGRRWAVALLLMLLAGGFAAVVVYAVRNAGGGEKERRGRDEKRATPVITAVATRGDFPVYVDALGSVAALNTVTLRSRVDGEILHVRYAEGQAVRKGDLLIEIDPRAYQATLQQAQGQLARDQAMQQNAQADVNRYTAARETVSQQQIDTANAALAEARAAIKVDQATIASAQLQVDYCRITSPIDGRIGLRAVDVGNVVRSGDATPLATITQLQPIAVVFNLPESNLPAVLDATRGAEKPMAEIFDPSRTRKLTAGAFEAIDNQIDATTATVRIKAVLDNAEGLLFPNQFVNVRLRLKTLKDVTLVPSSAVQNSPTTAFVYVVKDGTADMRPITAGATEGGRTIIENGVSAGEAVITDGLDKLAPGALVTPHDHDAATRPATRPKADAS